MESIDGLKKFLQHSPTCYQAIDNVIKMLKENDFEELKENQKWNLKNNKNYYVCRDGSSLIAFKTNEKSNGFNIIASHTDSPYLKIKGDTIITTDGYSKFNIEGYGGIINYTWLDKPLKVAGRVICENKNSGLLESVLFTSQETFVIPSLAVHMNRKINDNAVFNIQFDLSPLMSLNNYKINDLIYRNIDNNKYNYIDYDLYLYNSTENFYSGIDNEFLCSPRIDNLASVYSSVEALINTKENLNKTNLIALFDNEEVGSRTKQGAGSKFLIDVLTKINQFYNKNDLDITLNNSFMISLDNAHATHPNYKALNDPKNYVYMGKGIVIKHHENYTTDGFSSSILKYIFNKNNIPYQDFYMRSDMKCGSTLGGISSSQVSIRSVDIGIGQLAMHSNMETMAVSDYNILLNGLKSFFNSNILTIDYDKMKV